MNQRLSQIRQSMEPASVLVSYSGTEAKRNKDVLYPFRAESDFLYLADLNIPDSIFVLAQSGETAFFAPTGSPEERRWSSRFADPEHLSKSLGLPLSAIHDISKLAEILKPLVSGKDILYAPWKEEYSSPLSRLLTAWSAKTRGPETFPSSWKDLSSFLGYFRRTKDSDEIARLKESAQAAVAGHRAVLQLLRTFDEPMRERDAKREFFHAIHRNGAEELSYPVIAASGNHATVLHYERDTAEISQGSFFLMDAGAEYQGYASDITRTYPVGKLHSRKKEMYEIVLAAQKKAIERAVPGQTLESIHDTTVETLVEGLWNAGLLKRIAWEGEWIIPGSMHEVIQKQYYKLFYMHRTSHWLGLDVHDTGAYYENGQPVKLVPGMVFTVEPGLYFPEDYDFIPEELKGTGIRIEDDILITESGNENLTEGMPREFSELS